MCVAVGAPGASAALMSTHMIHDEAWSAARSERAHGCAPSQESSALSACQNYAENGNPRYR